MYPRFLPLRFLLLSLSSLVPWSGGFAFGVVSLAIDFLIPDALALALGLAGPDEDDAEAVPVPLASGASGA